LRAASILLDQWASALAGEVSQIDLLLSSNHANDAVRRLETVLQRSDVGLHLTTPWRVVLAGRPNVGKSSLINALLGYERSIVFNQPGTTRDVVTAAAALEGWPVELTDTAGLRALDEANSADALEAAGMAKAREQFAAADLLVLVFDATQPWRPEEEGLVQRWPSAVRVLSKCDVTGSPAGQRFVAEAGSGTASPFLRTSAITGEGIESLGRHIAAWLVPEVPPAGAPVPFTTRQVDLLTGAVAAAKSGQVAEARTLLVRLLSE
jgi:tRNA modification GTPase